MRLLNVLSLDFKEVTDPKFSGYAILSHTWVEGQEVSFQDWLLWRQKSPGWEEIERRSGHTKILDACEMTKEYNLEYLWVDTNCIDKVSSADLSEAINSMFKWYAKAAICFAYLADVNVDNYWGNNPERFYRRCIKTSRWFTRGWTLQELIAPHHIEFFSDNWTCIGSRISLSFTIHQITGIEEQYLDGSGSFRHASIASRMSWAARRKTSRIEDMAYALLGIFDIHMPLLYGEGEGAFIRLQEEILKVSTDQSIFAWEFVAQKDWEEEFEPHPSWVSVLAPSPICFRNSRDIKKTSHAGSPGALEIWTMTNLGLTMHLPLLATTNSRRFFGVLQCILGETSAWYLCIPFIKIEGELVRAAWPPGPLPLCRFQQQPCSVSVYLPRHHRHWSREDIWESSILPVSRGPRLLVFITFALEGHEMDGWITTPGAEFYSDHGFLLIENLECFEGVMIRLRQCDTTRRPFNAVIFSKPGSVKEDGEKAENYTYCQLWTEENDEVPSAWKEVKDSDDSDRVRRLLSGLLTNSMVLGAQERNRGVLMRTNPGGDMQAVLNKLTTPPAGQGLTGHRVTRFLVAPPIYRFFDFSATTTVVATILFLL
ncbi:HET-domain-containing protein [Xylariaceae sp. FL0255]|nr:HET-domain-containing protein [Xylariaceae sp. FL0255]